MLVEATLGGDFIPECSDIDIYVVLRDGDKLEFKKRLKKEAKKVEMRCLSNLKSIHDEVISVEVTTIEEVRSGRSFLGAGFEYQNFIRDGKLLWGRDIKGLIPKPSREAVIESAKRALMRIYEQIPKWENLARCLDEFGKERATRMAFSLIFRSAAIVLCGRGVYVGGKCEIVSAFRRLYPCENELNGVLDWALEMWRRWAENPLHDYEVERLNEEAFRFVRLLKFRVMDKMISSSIYRKV